MRTIFLCLGTGLMAVMFAHAALRTAVALPFILEQAEEHAAW